MSFHLPNPIGWIALDPRELQKARERAHQEVHLFTEAGESNGRNSDLASQLLTAEDAVRVIRGLPPEKGA
jgi:hypothetical protein